MFFRVSHFRSKLLDTPNPRLVVRRPLLYADDGHRRCNAIDQEYQLRHWHVASGVLFEHVTFQLQFLDVMLSVPKNSSDDRIVKEESVAFLKSRSWVPHVMREVHTFLH